MMGWRYGGDSAAAPPMAGPQYVVPSQTVIGMAAGERLGVHTADDLFGGLVPQPFVATKLISHPLFDPEGPHPTGWSHAFAEASADCVLPGWSVFSATDAVRAGRDLLRHGSVRLKDPGGVGGSGQCVVRTAAELVARVGALDPAALADGGLVLERHLNHVVTLSVGHAHVRGLRISYVGHQRLTANPHGALVYGGSDLEVIRGGFDALLAEPLEPRRRVAVEQAMRYHESAFRCFDGLFASRCNYDVAQGTDDEGRWRSGVLEQSWRIGGASGAEIAAMRALVDDPARQRVRASTHEVYGGVGSAPAGAWILFDGSDPAVGRLTKFVQVAPDEHL
jgi:hypothetical protein